MPRLKFLLATGMLMVCSMSAMAQSSFPISGDFIFARDTKYRLAADSPYLIWQQADANLVIYSASGQYQWGLYGHAAATSNKVTGLQFKAGNLVASSDSGVIWSALSGTPAAANKLVLGWRGALQIVSSDQATVLWSSDGNLSPDEGRPPDLLPATAPGADEPLAGSDISRLQDSSKTCRAGLLLLKSNMYEYPEKPTTSSGNRRPWTEVWPQFQSNYLPACKAVGAFLNENQRKKVVAAAEASYATFGVKKWEDYFDSNVGIVTHGTRIPQYCPGLHRVQFDCVEASRRPREVSIPGLEKILDLLSPLECMPESDYAHCRVSGAPKVTIFGTNKVSASAMRNVDHVYTTMLGALNSEYPASKFDGYKVYVTNGESIAELDALSPINGMWTTGTGEESRDWLRGGTNPYWLWISEQMICKTGVATRNLDGIKDSSVRTFDQVVHEFAHAIDMRFGLKSETESMYRGLTKPIEGFPWGVQWWFGTPVGTFRVGELTLMKKLFKNRQALSCEYYKP